MQPAYLNQNPCFMYRLHKNKSADLEEIHNTAELQKLIKKHLTFGKSCVIIIPVTEDYFPRNLSVSDEIPHLTQFQRRQHCHPCGHNGLLIRQWERSPLSPYLFYELPMSSRQGWWIS
ncbi:MAG: hypothetical protein IIV79_02470 [Clostridia bacterium]|nr:hypothetical protein [Clostridia bacterium]